MNYSIIWPRYLNKKGITSVHVSGNYFMLTFSSTKNEWNFNRFFFFVFFLICRTWRWVASCSGVKCWPKTLTPVSTPWSSTGSCPTPRWPADLAMPRWPLTATAMARSSSNSRTSRCWHWSKPSTTRPCPVTSSPSSPRSVPWFYHSKTWRYFSTCTPIGSSWNVLPNFFWVRDAQFGKFSAEVLLRMALNPIHFEFLMSYGVI